MVKKVFFFLFKFIGIIIAALLTLLLALLISAVFRMLEKPESFPPYYTSAEFGITEVKSDVDFNNNGVDDYTDLLLGARADALAMPEYDPACFEGGYPPDDIGVCTDLVWRAFKNAGYCLKDMVDNDIEKNNSLYEAAKIPYPDIDFRRVRNLKVFFENYAVSLTTNVNDIENWQAGDIVIFEDAEHIGIVSDKRNSSGQPFIIHNSGQLNREQDYLNIRKVSAHYRFDASKIPSDVLVAWHD